MKPGITVVPPESERSFRTRFLLPDSSPNRPMAGAD